MLRITLLLLLLALWQSPVMANNQQHHQKTISKEQATQLAQQRYPGKILKVQADRQIYRIRVLQADGRIINVTVDGRTGRVQRDDR